MADLRETLQNYDVLVTYILRLLEKFEVVTRLSDDLCLVPSQLDAFAESQVEERLSAALPMLGQVSMSPNIMKKGVSLMIVLLIPDLISVT